MTIYIASDEKYEGKIKEDLLIQEHFHSKGQGSEILTIPKILNQVSEKDTVILKSIWGYHLNHDIFLEQIFTLQRKSIKLINDYKYIYRNIDKHAYLTELSQFVGFTLIPTKIVDFKLCLTSKHLDSLIEEKIFSFEKESANDFVIKPNISASAYLTYKYKISCDNSEQINNLLINKDRQFIIQPFREQIVNGEISAVVLNGTVSYGIRRSPGVFAEKANPVFVEKDKINPIILHQVSLLYNFFSTKFNSIPNICRVDFVENGDNFEIMEVELIDPDLFFKFLPDDILNNCLSSLSNNLNS